MDKSFLEYFEEVSLMDKHELSEYIEDVVTESLSDSDLDVYSEASNREAHNKMLEVRKEITVLKHDMRQATKEKNADKVKEIATKGKSLIAETRKFINDPADDSVEDTAFGWIFESVVEICYQMLACLTMGFGAIPAVISGIHLVVGTIKRIASDVKDGSVTAATFNVYKNKLNSILDSTEKTFDKAIKRADELKKIMTEEKEVKESADLLCDESILYFLENADYDDPDQLELVESCLDLMMEGEWAAGYNDTVKLKSWTQRNQKEGKNTADAKPKANPVWDKYEQPELKDYAGANAKAARNRKIGTGASVAALVASVAGLAVLVKSIGPKCPEAKELMAEVKDLQKQVATIKKAADKGDMNPKIAAAKVKILEKKVETLQKKAAKAEEKAAKAAAKEEKKAKAVKESTMDLVGAKLAIYEAAMAGEITMDEKESLLAELED